MNSLLRKITFAGIGLTVVGKEKIEKIINEMAAQGELKKDEVDDLIQTAFDKSEEIKKSIEEKITTVVKNNLETFNFSSNKRVDELEAKVASLEKLIQELSR